MELYVKQMFALFNPDIAPLSFAGTFVSFFAGARHCPAFDSPLRRAQRQLNVPTVFS